MSKKKSKNYKTVVFFVRGKRRKRKIFLIDGLEPEEFIRRNADDVFLMQEGYFDILHEREQARNKTEQDFLAPPDSVSARAGSGGRSKH